MPWSQLHWCAFRDDAQGIKKLTKSGTFCCRPAFDPDIPDKAGATPLHVACAHGQCHAVEALINAGADTNVATKLLEGEQQDGQHASGAPDGGETPLHWIVKLRYKPEERAYVQNVRAEVHSGHTICARHLLVAGADVNAQSEATGTTALHESVRNGFDEITRLLIYEFGADCGIKDKDGHTPKSLAGKSRLRDLMDRYEESMGISEKPGRKMPSTPPPRGPTAQP